MLHTILCQIYTSRTEWYETYNVGVLCELCFADSHNNRITALMTNTTFIHVWKFI
jgi:hypothetical protein